MFVAHGHGGVWPTQVWGAAGWGPRYRVAVFFPFSGRAALPSSLLSSPLCGCLPHPEGARLNPGWGSEDKRVPPCPQLLKPGGGPGVGSGSRWAVMDRCGPGGLETRVVGSVCEGAIRADASSPSPSGQHNRKGAEMPCQLLTPPQFPSHHRGVPGGHPGGVS